MMVVDKGMPKKIDWLGVGREILDKVLDALDYWCWEVHGDPLECYSAHEDLGLYTLAEEFVGWSRFDITDEDLEILSQMPDKYYNKLDAELTKSIESTVRKLLKYYSSTSTRKKRRSK